MARKTPPVCRTCRGPILWAHSESGTPVPVDAKDIGDQERLEEPRFDPSRHKRHACPSWLEQFKSQIGAQVSVFDGEWEHGRLEVVEGDHIILCLSNGAEALFLNAHIRRVVIGEPAAQDRT